MTSETAYRYLKLYKEMEVIIMKMKAKTGIYISCFGVLVSVFIVMFQALFFANITILFSNLSRYKKQREDSNT